MIVPTDPPDLTSIEPVEPMPSLDGDDYLD
ncbi:hypothetical protein AS850_11965 [Frondihabitans sp. 762G35]|nr:hypothetical protein AS850_11965 [Frondihabitans sp. 762G35]